jgi:hypothetical protein
MTMMPPAHPDPERLAALAGGDADATADHALTAHVAGCAECGSQVQGMTALRAALAELPDLTPSRPLQLVPPVAAPPQPAGWRVTFRRAFAPVAVGGMVLLLVGGIGATGALGPADVQRLFVMSQAASGDSGSPERPANEEAAPGVTSSDGGGLAPLATVPATRGVDNGIVGEDGSSPDPAEAPGGGEDNASTRGEAAPEPPASEDLDSSVTVSGWVLLAVIGLGLLVLAFVLRIAGPKRISTAR